MKSVFNYITPLIYWALVLSWLFIFVFYFRRITKRRFRDRMLAVLFTILCIDSLRTLFESTYFGIWYTSLSGLIDISYYNFLAQPQIVFIPKIINLTAAFLIIFILIKKWVPKEGERLENFKREHQYNQTIMDQLPVSVVITDLLGNIQYINSKFTTLTGYTPEEAIGQNPRILNTGEKSVTDYDELWNTLLRGQEWTGLFFNKKKNGEFYWENAVISPLRDEDGVIRNYLAVKEDVTEKMALDNEREMLLSALEQSKDTVEILDVEGRIQYVNSAFVKNTGYTKEEALGRLPLELFQGDSEENARTSEELWKQISNGYSWTGRFSNTMKDGHIQEEDVSISPVINKAGTIVNYTCVKRNLTELLRMEEEKRNVKDQLFHAQKLESIGQLAGGVAHDFNNILSGILTAASLLDDPRWGLDEKGRKYVSMILKSSERAADLTNSLLSISRRGKSNDSLFSLGSVVKETVNILKFTVEKRIVINAVINVNNDAVFGDPSAFQNILLNLGINASHAIEKNGIIEFRLENMTIDQQYCDNSPFAILPGEFCCLEIEDTGSGIPDDILPYIFDPFFTTKKEGQGTGLGLSSVMGTIRANHGEVTVRSQKDVGTVFRLLIPCSRQKSTVQEESQIIMNGSERVLLVDDEEYNRALGAEILGSIGYQVLLASNGAEALTIYTEHQDSIDIIVLDMNMPVMDGKDTFLKLKEMNPDVKIIISSGYGEHEKIRDLKASGLKDVIIKPYRISEFSKLLRTVLDRT